jgi:Protein of unknown function (DUF3037)
VWYDYAVVRLMPRVERQEFLNVGVVLFSREMDFLGARFEVDPLRVASLAPELDPRTIARHLATFQAICDGEAVGGPIAALPKPERFHWLVAPRSTVVQVSPVHSGLCDDPERALARLMDAMVRVVREPPAP